MVFLKEFYEKVDFEKKNQQMTKQHAKLPSRQRLAAIGYVILLVINVNHLFTDSFHMIYQVFFVFLSVSYKDQ